MGFPLLWAGRGDVGNRSLTWKWYGVGEGVFPLKADLAEMPACLLQQHSERLSVGHRGNPIPSIWRVVGEMPEKPLSGGSSSLWLGPSKQDGYSTQTKNPLHCKNHPDLDTTTFPGSGSHPGNSVSILFAAKAQSLRTPLRDSRAFWGPRRNTGCNVKIQELSN